MATQFKDGPAAGVTLSLQRSPLFLRVVRSDANGWDALDEDADQPAPDETIFVYRLEARHGGAFIDGRDLVTNKRFGYYQDDATYVYREVQPDNAAARDPKAWEAWCREQTGAAT